ncbi:MAG: DUF3047 domain-containing protein, partial [Nitrospirae bacterium]|nr:DUF3047 domain-containing protein [Nitrospirota bacterium]
MLGSCSVAILVAVWLFSAAGVTLWADSPGVLEVGKFSAGQEGEAVPAGWKPLTFKKVPKQTVYALVKDGDTVVVKAVSQGSASGLTKEVKIDPKEYPIVRWRWKVENLLKKSDVGRKDGDDYPARLYVTFEYDADKVSFGRKVKYKAGKVIFGDIPVGALNYIWDTKAPVGDIVDNAYTDFAKLVVIRSGSAGVGTWVEQERNVYEDYKKAFDEEPGMISGVAIMSDTDNTGESAAAYFGDI